MRSSITALIVSFGLISFAASANKIQLDRRQFLVGTASVSTLAAMPGPALALAKFGASSPLTARVQALIGETMFSYSLNPHHMTGVIGNFNYHNAIENNRIFFTGNRAASEAVIREAYKTNATKDLGTWRRDIDWVEQASQIQAIKTWGELSAIEMAEGEFEVARILKIPLQSVQEEVDALRHLARYLHEFAGRGPGLEGEILVKQTSLGENFLKVYLQVMEKRIPRFKEVIGRSLDFYSRYYSVPAWMKDYDFSFHGIYKEMVRAELQSNLAEAGRLARSTAVEEIATPAARGSGSLRQFANALRGVGQSCADFVQNLGRKEVLAIEQDSASVLQLPAPIQAPVETPLEENSARAEFVR